MKILIKKATILTLVLSGSMAFAAKDKPDKDMKKVLDQLQSKNGKPIENLSAEEARRQPTPADAVKDILTKEKKNKQPKLSDVRNISIKGADGEIPARVYIPEVKGPFPVVVYYHGGSNEVKDGET